MVENTGNPGVGFVGPIFCTKRHRRHPTFRENTEKDKGISGV